MKKLFKKALIATALAMPVLAYSAATPILFNPDGVALGLPTISIDLLDWAPGNALAVNGNPTTGFLLPGSQTKLLYQANLALASLNGVNVYAAGLSGPNFTAVAGFNEVVLTNSLSGLNPTFGLSPTAGTSRNVDNFFYVYANTFGSNLAGTGFVGSTIALSGYIQAVNSSNYNSLGQINPVLDNFNNNDYPGIQSLIGSGATDLRIVIDGTSAFFPNLVAGSSISFFNTSTVTPFSTVDPSACFSSNGTTATNAACTNLTNTPLNVGAVNGVRQLGDVSNRNFVFVADGNSSFQQVPEPGSLALLGLALGIAGFVRRRTAKQA